MSQVLKHDPDNGVTIVGNIVYFSLGDAKLWTNLSKNPHASDTYKYDPLGSRGEGSRC
jgi:hypothetical protein